MELFDYKKVAHEANIPDDKLQKLGKIIRMDFPHDDMMFELHMLRACLAIKRGHITIEDAIRSEMAMKT